MCARGNPSSDSPLGMRTSRQAFAAGRSYTGKPGDAPVCPTVSSPIPVSPVQAENTPRLRARGSLARIALSYPGSFVPPAERLIRRSRMTVRTGGVAGVSGQHSRQAGNGTVFPDQKVP